MAVTTKMAEAAKTETMETMEIMAVQMQMLSMLGKFFLQAEGAWSRDIRADVLSVGDICIHLHELY